MCRKRILLPLLQLLSLLDSDDICYSGDQKLIVLEVTPLFIPRAMESSSSGYSYEERLLVGSEKSNQDDEQSDASTSSSSTKSVTTVRLESMAEWSNDSWILPVGFDLLNGHPYIKKVQIGIASHPTQTCPSNILDSIPLLLSTRDNRHAALPQGFFLSIETQTNTNRDTSSAAVDAVLESLIHNRLLTTPITEGTWDVVAQSDGLAYNMFLPFNGAGWSSDALEQTFRRTLPTVCSGDSEEISFFGWSSRQWSNFLVGNLDNTSQIPVTKQMWWTWTSSSSSSTSFNFGIHYQVLTKLLPESSPNGFVPKAFLSESSVCNLGLRRMFQVVPNENRSYEMIAFGPDGSRDMSSTMQSSHMSPYKATIDQVLRRHHTNRGRFESNIDIQSLQMIDSTASKAKSCELIYRQVFPKFLSPIWQSLNATSSITDAAEKGLNVWVEWKPEDQASILYVKSFSAVEKTSPQLPSSIFISLEYAPTFLTLDDFPGDPNRGRELPPAHLTIQCIPTVADHRLSEVSVYSNSLLLLPPVPDMSMPFNVISLTSSLYAYIVGTLLTILVRKGSERIKFKLYPKKKPESKLQKLKQRIKTKLSRLKRSVKKNEDDGEGVQN